VTPPARRAPATGLIVAAAGMVLLVGCGLVARTGTVGSVERSVFRAVNDLPSWLYRPMWVFQQAGNVAVALGLVVVVAVLLRRVDVALLGVVAVVAKLGLERVVKALVERQRPGTSIGHVVLRGRVPAHGLSFVSGHAVMTAALATMLMAVLPRRWRPVPWALVALNGLARVYVGAHNPLDVLGGVALGLVIGGPLLLVLGRRPPRPTEVPSMTPSPEAVQAS
jgi:undecaprenyl-diphosphatase